LEIIFIFGSKKLVNLSENKINLEIIKGKNIKTKSAIKADLLTQIFHKTGQDNHLDNFEIIHQAGFSTFFSCFKKFRLLFFVYQKFIIELIFSFCFLINCSCLVFSSFTLFQIVSRTFAKGIKIIEKIKRFTKKSEKPNFKFPFVFIIQDIKSHQPGINQRSKNEKIIGLAQKNKYQTKRKIEGTKTKLKNKLVKKINL